MIRALFVFACGSCLAVAVGIPVGGVGIQLVPYEDRLVTTVREEIATLA